MPTRAENRKIPSGTEQMADGKERVPGNGRKKGAGSTNAAVGGGPHRGGLLRGVGFQINSHEGVAFSGLMAALETVSGDFVPAVLFWYD